MLLARCFLKRGGDGKTGIMAEAECYPGHLAISVLPEGSATDPPSWILQASPTCFQTTHFATTTEFFIGKTQHSSKFPQSGFSICSNSQSLILTTAYQGLYRTRCLNNCTFVMRLIVKRYFCGRNNERQFEIWLVF